MNIYHADYWDKNSRGKLRRTVALSTFDWHCGWHRSHSQKLKFGHWFRRKKHKVYLALVDFEPAVCFARYARLAFAR